VAEVEDAPITLDSTLADILARMAALGENYLARKKVDSLAITDLTNRKFWVIPGAEGPSCVLEECGSEVENLIALKIDLA
jgi:hypothetical protein